MYGMNQLEVYVNENIFIQIYANVCICVNRLTQVGVWSTLLCQTLHTKC